MVRGMTQRPTTDTADYILPGVAAAKLGVAVYTLSRWADAGQLRAVTLPSGHRRYSREDVERIANEGSAA